MMAEVTRCCQERRLAVLITAVTGNRLQPGQGSVDGRQAGPVEGELEKAQIVLDVLTFPQPRAYNDPADSRLFENVAGGDVGHRDDHRIAVL